MKKYKTTIITYIQKFQLNTTYIMIKKLNLDKNINTKFTQKEFASVLHKYQYNLHLGDIVAGTIFGKEVKGVLVDIGATNAAFLPKAEFSIKNNQRLSLNMNETYEFFILAHNKNSSQLILSTRRLEYIRIWERVKQLQEEDLIIYANIIGKNNGGLLVNLDGIKGFLPNSHIVNLDIKEALINTQIPLKFLSADEKLNQLIFSQRRAILTLNNFIIGNTVNATVVKIKYYGIFVKIQNILALLHISEIPPINAHKLAKTFPVNSKLKVMILHIDNKQGRLSVSIKKLSS